MSARFYLGTHEAQWLARQSMPPLFVSARRLARYASRGDAMHHAFGSWALDSGGFTELAMHGEWTIDADLYGGMVTRLMEDVGCPDFAAPQDWMCEPQILAKTGLTVRDHQAFTVDNFVYLAEQFPFVPWVPVLQGWTLADYERCADMYAAAGVDLAAAPLVGLGSVCRRQATDEIGAIVSTFAAEGWRLHGFGVKTSGLREYGHLLASADSLAWSYKARKAQIRLDGCQHPGWCSSCPRWALQWRERVLEALAAAPARPVRRTAVQLDLFELAA